MEDGELDFSNQVLNMDDQLPNSCSMDSFFDEILKDSHACTHTHTCNPPGPDYSHTHTCFHVHTKILPAQTDDDKVGTDDTGESVDTKSKKRPSGNREAVRKYREKKKARAASLEDEVIRLRTLNQQLMKRMQGHTALESEVARLKCLLVDIRGRIEGEIGSFPYQKPTKATDRIPQNMSNSNLIGSYAVNSCDFRCDDDQLYCLHPEMDNRGSGETGVLNGGGFGDCDVGYVPCTGNTNSGYKELSDCGPTNIGSNINLNPSAANKRKGGARTLTAA